MYRRALDGEEKSLGKDRRGTLFTVHEMAKVFRRQGKYDEALGWSGEHSLGERSHSERIIHKYSLLCIVWQLYSSNRGRATRRWICIAEHLPGKWSYWVRTTHNRSPQAAESRGCFRNKGWSSRACDFPSTRQFQKYWNGRPSLGAKDKAGRSNVSEIDEYSTIHKVSGHLLVPSHTQVSRCYMNRRVRWPREEGEGLAVDARVDA